MLTTNKQRWSVGPPDQDFRKNTVYNLYYYKTSSIALKESGD